MPWPPAEGINCRHLITSGAMQTVDPTFPDGLGCHPKTPLLRRPSVNQDACLTADSSRHPPDPVDSRIIQPRIGTLSVSLLTPSRVAAGAAGRSSRPRR